MIIDRLKGIIHAVIVKFRARNMKYIFMYCDMSKKLDLKEFDTSNITDMKNIIIGKNYVDLNFSEYFTENNAKSQD